MEERQEKAIDKMQLDQFAVHAVRCGLQYNAARAKRYRMLREGIEDGQHIPTVEELAVLKDKLHESSARYKTVVKKELEDQDEKRRDRDIGILKQQVLDLNDKFDYFVCMMLKG